MDRPTLLQVFSPLLAKLAKLELYHDTIRYSEVPDDIHLMHEIEKEVFNYPPKDAIALIENCLLQIERLIRQGEAIVSTVTVVEYNDELGEFLPTDEKRSLETKNELYTAINAELNLFEFKLSMLKEILSMNLRIGLGSNSDINGELEIDLTKKLPKRLSKTNESPLDRYQTALLFHYLLERNIILRYSQEAMGQLVSHLTGHSPNTLSKLGFGAIGRIQSDSPEAVNKVESKGINNYNLNKVKTELESIITEIDKEITRQIGLSKKK